MADLIEIDLLDIDDTLQATFQTEMELTSYADGTTIFLEAG